MAMLENELKMKCKTYPKLIWPLLFKGFINGGFGVTKGNQEDAIYWIEKFNEIRKPVQIDKYISRVRYPTQGFEDIVIILALDEISSFLLHYPDCVWISSNDDILKPLCGITDGGDILR